MRFHLGLFFVLIVLSGFGQSSERLEIAIKRIKETQPYIPEGITLSYDQRTLLRKRHDEKIRAETTLLKREYVVENCYMTTLVDSVVQSLQKANPEIPAYTEAFIYKSTAFNAFTMGEDILFINANLVYECRNVHELATVIAHEIAHNSLNHAHNEQIRLIQFITNDSLQKEFRSASRQEYGRVTALNTLLLPKILNDKELSRKQELQADELGMKYIIAAGFNPILGVKVFEIMKYYGDAAAGKMDYSKLQPDVENTLLLKEKGYSRSNSLGFSKPIETEWDPYLRSHPYSDDRYTAIFETFQLKDTTEGLQLYDENTKTKLYIEMSKIAFQPGALTRYEYMAIENYTLSADAKKNCAFGFSVLGFLKERFVSGKYLDRQNVGQPEGYDRICYSLSNCSSDNFYTMANSIKPDINVSNPNISQEELIMGIVDLVKKDDKETLEILWKLYAHDLKASEYGWFIDQIEDYLYTVKRYIFVKQIK